ncbi:DUF4232 domain-containing protein [Rothia terrae]|uniref:DUF4232 domain-containing protein n=1 Tax=Rothia terrae TaxID=396015 RepID=A0A7H2BCX0_9MICC|nr:DUF4232 domain-containing protein [Rothia terrae]QNV37516.1 DUF4232 domain-containing protein [Rothia terrae]
MAGFSPRSVLGVGALCATLLLSACSTQQDAALQPPSPTPPSSSASATAEASPIGATSASASVASEDPSPTAAQPTVVEQDPVVPSEQPQESSQPTGTETTVEPVQPSESARASEQASTPAQASDDACSLRQTVVSAEAKGGAGAAGSQYLTLTFTNNGSTPCTISGYPTVSYVDNAGQTIGAPASLAAEWTSSAVTLEPGRSTTAILRETRADLFGDRCKPVTSSGYRIQLPQTTESLSIPYPSEGCSDTSIQQLSVGQVGASV